MNTLLTTSSVVSFADTMMAFMEEDKGLIKILQKENR